MTWMIVRLILSLAFVGAVLWFAARLAKKRGLGQGSGLIEVVARQRMGRASSVNVVRIADRVLVVGATDEQITLLAEVDGEAVEAVLAAQRTPVRAGALGAADGEPEVPLGRVVSRPLPTGALAGSVFDRSAWTSFVTQLRERTVRR